MRDSYKFLDRLIHCFQQKKIAIERNRVQQSQLNDKVDNSLAEEQQVKEKMNALVSYTKQLKEQVRPSSLVSLWPSVNLIDRIYPLSSWPKRSP